MFWMDDFDREEFAHDARVEAAAAARDAEYLAEHGPTAVPCDCCGERIRCPADAIHFDGKVAEQLGILREPPDGLSDAEGQAWPRGIACTWACLETALILWAERRLTIQDVRLDVRGEAA